jgi:hypothetical protein
MIDECKVTAVRYKGPEHARMVWNTLEQLGDSGGSFNTKEHINLRAIQVTEQKSIGRI